MDAASMVSVLLDYFEKSKNAYVWLETCEDEGLFSKLDPKVFELERYDGTTLLHVLARHKLLSTLPSEVMTAQSVTKKNAAGKSPLSIALEARCIEQVPERLITSETMFVHYVDNEYRPQNMPVTGVPLLELACVYEEAENLPEAFWTKDVAAARFGARSTCLHLLAQHGLLELVSEHLTEELVMARDDGYNTVLHVAAANGCLDKVPEKLLVDCALSSGRDGYNNTVFHIAAQSGYLDQLPASLLTRDSIFATGAFKRTCVHCAALNQNGDVKQIPAWLLGEGCMHREYQEATPLHLAAESGKLKDFAELLDEEALYAVDKSGDTVFHLAARYGDFAGIPKKYINAESLLLEDNVGKTALSYLSVHNTLDLVLGTPLPDYVKDVDPEWLHKNAELVKSLASISGEVLTSSEIDLF